MFRVVVASIAALLVAAPMARADEVAPTLPVFTLHPSAWQPDYTVFPYNLWQIRVTPNRSPRCGTPASGSTPSTTN